MFIAIDQASGKAVQINVVDVEHPGAVRVLRTGTAVCRSVDNVWELLEAMYGPDDSFWRGRFVPTEVDAVEGPQVCWPVEETETDR